MDHRCIQVPTFHDIRKKEENTIPNSMICFFMAGFCLGMVFFYLSDKAYAKESGLMDTTHIRQLQEFRANKTGLLQYVAVRRIWQFFLVGLCACSKLCSILLQLLIGVCGFSLGILLFTAVYRYRVMGLFLGAALFLPHWILYMAMICRVMHISRQSDTKYYHKISHIKLLIDVISIILLLIAGILCETYVNPYLLQKIAAAL